MEVYKDKISIRQAVTILFLGLGAPALRVIPNYISKAAENAGWISIILALIPSILLVLILASLLKNKEGSLYDVYKDIFGKVICNILAIVYIVWTIFLASFYLRMYGERFILTVLFNSNIIPLILLMAIFIYFLVNQKIDVLGRMAEFLYIIFAFIVVVVFIIIFPKIEIKYLWPVTYYDIGSIFKGIQPILTISFYITAIMFLGDKISNKKEIKKNGIGLMIFLTIISLIVLLSTTGLLGYKLNAQLLFPYFSTLKNIKILNSIERVESLIISTWLGADTAIISIFVLVALNLTKQVFNQNSYKKFSIWYIIAIVIIAIIFTPNVYVAEKFARIYIAPVNDILFGIIPFIAWLVGKFRKVI